MVDLKLEQNEHIIRRTKEAWRFDGDKEHKLQFLVLTNEHLISIYEKSVALFFIINNNEMSISPLESEENKQVVPITPVEEIVNGKKMCLYFAQVVVKKTILKRGSVKIAERF